MLLRSMTPICSTAPAAALPDDAGSHGSFQLLKALLTYERPVAVHCCLHNPARMSQFRAFTVHEQQHRQSLMLAACTAVMTEDACCILLIQQPAAAPSSWLLRVPLLLHLHLLLQLHLLLLLNLLPQPRTRQSTSAPGSASWHSLSALALHALNS
jgi:hypothetical protein